jgi:hypothetical protein
MNFSTHPDYIRIGKLFEELPQAISGMDRTAMETIFVEERRFRTRLIDGLNSLEGHLMLAKDTRPKLCLTADALQHICVSRLRYSIFDTLDYRLESLKSYDGATILLESSTFGKILRALKPARGKKGGRPTLSGKKYYAAQNFERRGRSINELQREIENAVGEAPSISTIYLWEGEAK